MADWTKEIAEQINARDRARENKHERAALLRKLAHAGGTQLFEDLAAQMVQDAGAISSELPTGHPSAIIGPNKNEKGGYTFRTATKYLELWPALEADGLSTVQYVVDKIGQQTNDANSYQFMLTDSDILELAETKGGQLQLVSVADVSQALIRRLLSSQN